MAVMKCRGEAWPTHNLVRRRRSFGRSSDGHERLKYGHYNLSCDPELPADTDGAAPHPASDAGRCVPAEHHQRAKLPGLEGRLSNTSLLICMTSLRPTLWRATPHCCWGWWRCRLAGRHRRLHFSAMQPRPHCQACRHCLRGGRAYLMHCPPRCHHSAPHCGEHPPHCCWGMVALPPPHCCWAWRRCPPAGRHRQQKLP